MTSWDDLTVGTAAPEREYGPISRTDIVAYQGASGDFNPIHHDDEFAQSAGYPSAFSVGMLQAGILASYATDWLGQRNVRTFGVQFLVSTVVNIVSQIVATPLSLLGGVAVSLIDPTGAIDSWVPVIVLYVLTLLLSLVLGAVAAVVQSGTTALIYIDLRMRKEGLDLELARFVESAPGSGATDPYLVGAAGTEAPGA